MKKLGGCVGLALVWLFAAGCGSEIYLEPLTEPRGEILTMPGYGLHFNLSDQQPSQMRFEVHSRSAPIQLRGLELYEVLPSSKGKVPKYRRGCPWYRLNHSYSFPRQLTPGEPLKLDIEVKQWPQTIYENCVIKILSDASNDEKFNALGFQISGMMH